MFFGNFLLKIAPHRRFGGSKFLATHVFSISKVFFPFFVEKKFYNFSCPKSYKVHQKKVVSFNVLTKSKLLQQVRILVPQNCKLHQSLSNSPKNEKSLWHIQFKVLKKPSISRWFAIFSVKLLKYKQFWIENSESAGNQSFFEESKVKRSEDFLVLWGEWNALVQLAALYDFYSHLQDLF